MGLSAFNAARARRKKELAEKEKQKDSISSPKVAGDKNTPATPKKQVRIIKKKTDAEKLKKGKE